MTLSQFLLPMQSQWLKESTRQSAESKAGIPTVQFSCKNVSCEQFYTHTRGIPAH